MSHASTASNPPAQPPIARRDPTSTTLHGVTLHDDFRWMRDKSSPELLAYLEAENAYTAAVMAPTAELQTKLYDEMIAHIQETDESVPYRLGDWFYSTRTVEGSQYPIHCRRAAASPDLNSAFDPAQPEQIILDVNALAKGKPFMDVGAMAISPTATSSHTPPIPPASASTRCTSVIFAPEPTWQTQQSASARWPGPPTRAPSSTPPRTRPPSARTASCATPSASQSSRTRRYSTKRTSVSTLAFPAPATAST